MQRSRLLSYVLVAAVVLLHLGAHFGVRAPHFREALPDDAPALLANPALAPSASLGELLTTATVSPGAAWHPAGEVVARQRFRPLTTALFVLERHYGRAGTATLAGIVGLLLHLALVLGTARLVRALGGRDAAAWLAGLLTAATPIGLIAAWPARQGVVLATVLGVTAARLAIAPGGTSVGAPDGARAGGLRIPRALAAGGLLALAFLAHEFAAGAALAVALLVLVGAAEPDGREAGPGSRLGRRLASIAALALPVAVAAAWRASMLLAAPADAASDGPDVFDGLVGLTSTLAAPLLPARMHLVGGPSTASALARLLAPALLALVLVGCIRRRSSPWAVAGLAAVAAAIPAVFAAHAGGALHHATYAYAVLPFVAAALGLSAQAALGGGKALRTAAAVASALLVGASVAATLPAAPSFRTRAAFVARAQAHDPTSRVAEAWALGDAVATAGDDADILLALLPRARALAAGLEPDPLGQPSAAASALRADGPAAITTATVLAAFVRALSATPDERLPMPGAVQFVDLPDIAAGATAVAPEWDGAWVVLAQACTRVGSVARALDAATRAAELLPGDVPRIELVARLAHQLGRTDLAVAAMERAARFEEVRVSMPGAQRRREHLFLHAMVLAGDASARSNLFQFDQAARLLQPLFDDGDREPDLIQALYDIYLRWGDSLASLDRTAMARLAYGRAASLGGERSDAAEHLRWLDERLAQERIEAETALERATQGEGNIADALLGIAIVFCRSAHWSQADGVFAKIEEGQGGMNANLRLARAVHRFAARDDELARAAEEFRLVLAEDPQLVEAGFQLGHVLAELGLLEEAAAAYRRAAIDGAAFEWSAEALIRARVIEDLLQARGR